MSAVTRAQAEAPEEHPITELTVSDIEACRDALPPTTEQVATHNLLTRCPELGLELIALTREEHRVTGFVASKSGPVALTDLAYFLSRSMKAPADRGFAFDPNALEELAAEILEPDSQTLNWWDRFLNWLRTRSKDGHQDLRWLEKFLGWLKPPEWAAELLFKGSIVAILLLAVLVVANELKFARGWWRRGEDQASRLGGASLDGERSTQGLEQILALEPHKRPGALLRLVIRELSNRGLIGGERARTNRELARTLRQKDPKLGERFAAFVRTVERVVYGDRRLNEGEHEDLARQARELLLEPPAPELPK